MIAIIDYGVGNLFSLTSSLGSIGAETVITSLSFVCCFALWCFSVYLMLRAGASLSLFFFSVSLFARLFMA